MRIFDLLFTKNERVVSPIWLCVGLMKDPALRLGPTYKAFIAMAIVANSGTR